MLYVTSIKETNFGLSYQYHKLRKVSFYDLPQKLRVDRQKCWFEMGDQRRSDDAQTIMGYRAVSSEYHRYSHSLRKDMIVGLYEGGSICNENPFLAPSTNVLGLYAICQTKDQSIAVIIVQETLFYLSEFNKLRTF